MIQEFPDQELAEFPPFLAPPSTPDESFAKAAAALGEIRYWHQRYACLVLAGLQTEPGYHANDIRLDWLQRLILSKAIGKKKPSPKDLGRILNEGLEKADVLHLEDPIEDTFCDLIVTSSGNFRIILGRWESAAAYTQTVLDAFSSLPDGAPKRAALKAAYALLRLSDELCERSGIDRGVASGGVPTEKIRLPSKERLNDLIRRVRFRNRDLAGLGIEPDVLRQFCLRDLHIPYVSREIGDTPLEFHPLLEQENGFAVVSPTNICLAVRAVLIRTAVAGGMGEALQIHLMECQERFSELTGFWPTGSIRLSPPNEHFLRTSVCRYDHGLNCPGIIGGCLV